MTRALTRALTVEEILALPAAVDIVTAGQALGGIGRTKAHELARSGRFPVEALRIGNRYVVRRADLLVFLGLGPPETSGAGAHTPAPATDPSDTPAASGRSHRDPTTAR